MTQETDESYMVRSMSINNLADAIRQLADQINLADAIRQLADQISQSNSLVKPKVVVRTVDKPVYVDRCNCWWCRLTGGKW